MIKIHNFVHPCIFASAMKNASLGKPGEEQAVGSPGTLQLSVSKAKLPDLPGDKVCARTRSIDALYLNFSVGAWTDSDRVGSELAASDQIFRHHYLM